MLSSSFLFCFMIEYLEVTLGRLVVESLGGVTKLSIRVGRIFSFFFVITNGDGDLEQNSKTSSEE